MANEPSEPVGSVSNRSQRLIALLAVAASTALHAQPAPTIKPANPRAVVEVGRYHLQSNPWVNLHQRLVHEARFQTVAPAALSGEDLSRWKKAVEMYRAFLGKRIRSSTMSINALLSATSTPEPPIRSLRRLLAALKAAMPLYRAVQSDEDDCANHYQPYIANMYERAFCGFRKPLETRWQAYLDGEASRGVAIRQILIETAPAEK